MLQVCDTLLERCSLIWTKISNGCSDGIWSYATAYELNHIHTNQTIHWAMCICCVLHKFIPVFNLIKPIPHLSTLCKFWLTDWLTDRCEWVADVCVCVSAHLSGCLQSTEHRETKASMWQALEWTFQNTWAPSLVWFSKPHSSSNPIIDYTPHVCSVTHTHTKAQTLLSHLVTRHM